MATSSGGRAGLVAKAQRLSPPQREIALFVGGHRFQREQRQIVHPGEDLGLLLPGGARGIALAAAQRQGQAKQRRDPYRVSHAASPFHGAGG